MGKEKGSKFSAKKEEPKKSSLEKKLKAIDDSKMPQWQKDHYKATLTGGEVVETGKISFTVYANMKKIPEHLREGMKHYPPAKDKGSATLAEWEEIFKSF